MEKAPDLSCLTDLPLDKFTQLSLSLIDEMTGFVPLRWSKIVADWTEETTKSTKAALASVVTEAVLSDGPERARRLRLLLDDEKSDRLSECIQSRKLDLAKTLMRRHNSTAGADGVLEDFDWSVKWILGDSTSTVTKYPLVKLDLSVLKGDQTKRVTLELNRNELDTLLTTLEAHNR